MHYAAGNLPWHRLHLLEYEFALRQECGYDGWLPYWEWELEWKDPFHSPVFDLEIGFGGDGEQLAGSLKHLQPLWFVIYYAFPIYKPHSIIRNFTDMFKDPNTKPGTYSEVQFGPERLAELMEMNNYEQFNEAIENLHEWLPNAVGGDFLTLAAPNGMYTRL